MVLKRSALSLALVGLAFSQCPLPSGSWSETCPGPAAFLGPCEVEAQALCLVNTVCLDGAGKTHDTAFQYTQGAPPFLQNIQGLLVDSANNKGLDHHGTLPCANQTRLQAHVVAHSHDDVGWLITPSEYYTGCHPERKDTGVRGIISSVVDALVANPQRRFIQVEQYFFSQWWAEQTPARQNQTRALVDAGRLQFVNGGWSMHDEACVHHRSAISNMALGAQFVKDTLNATVRIGWHIDPFGHASATPRLMAQMGFDAFFFCGSRMDHQQRDQMMSSRSLEFVWRSSPSLGSSVDMFTSILYDHYDAGCGGCCTSGLCCLEDCHNEASRKRYGPQSVETSPTVKQMANDYASLVYRRAANFRTQHQLLTFGDDFQFQNAADNFNRMDAIMQAINSDPSYGIDIFYSTPAMYVDAVHATGLAWPVNKYDFYPMGENQDAYWTGYFTSRPAFKGYERRLMAELLSAEILHSVARPAQWRQQLDQIDALRQALGVAQHHDSITGTEKSFVRDNYQFMLEAGATQARSAVSQIVGGASDPAVTFCPLANISICPSTAGLSGAGASVDVLLFNPLAWARTEYVSVPVPVQTLAVTTSNGTVVASQIVTNGPVVLDPDNTSPTAGAQRQPYSLVFPVSVGPLATERLTIRQSAGAQAAAVAQPREVQADAVIENEFYRVTVSGTTGLLTSVANKLVNATVAVEQALGFYCPFRGPGQASGAYVLRTCNASEKPQEFGKPQVVVTIGPLFQQIEQRFDNASHVNQIIRLYRGQRSISVITGVGEIEAGDTGKEIVSVFRTSITSGLRWFTDSEGLEAQERRFNFRPAFNYTPSQAVASNFYPSNVWAYMTNVNSSFLVVHDRSRGVASLNDGELQLHLHRRLLADDGKGVGEALSENTRIVTHNLLVVGEGVEDMHGLRGELATRHTYPLQVMFSGNKGTSPPAQAQSLPPNVQLLSLQTSTKGDVVVRLHHLYAVGEHQKLSQPATVDLALLLPQFKWGEVVETDLNAVQPLTAFQRLNWETSSEVLPKRVHAPIQGTVVTLNPMEIRTFVANVM